MNDIEQWDSIIFDLSKSKGSNIHINQILNDE